MTMPPTPDDTWQPVAAHAPRHAAQSPSGSYLPPVDDDESATSQLPRIDDSGYAGYSDAGYSTTAYSGTGHSGTGYSETGYSETGYSETGYSETGYSETGYSEAGYADTGYADGVVVRDHEQPAGEFTSAIPDRDWVPEPQPGSRPSAAGPSALRLVWIYPDLLSTYGDRGNLIMLARRARLRGYEVEAIELNSDQPVPTQADIYLLGGGEDLPQVLAAQRLRADGGLTTAAENGAVIFAVCAGYQLIGSVFGGAQGEPVEGLGILDIRSGRGERRGVGELAADVDPELGVDRLTGFENHQGVTTPGPGARPLARTLTGVGNGDGTEGAYSGRILGTYLHGPALVRNPGLADLLLTWAVGTRLAPLADADEAWTRQLRAERLAAVSA